jgi:hypothetical protein
MARSTQKGDHMARISYALTEFNEGFNCEDNPEIILMRRQGDEQECDVEISAWHAGTAVTQPKSTTINY